MYLGSIGIKITKKSVLFMRKRQKPSVTRVFVAARIACVSRVWTRMRTLDIFDAKKRCVQTAGCRQQIVDPEMIVLDEKQVKTGKDGVGVIKSFPDSST